MNRDRSRSTNVADLRNAQRADVQHQQSAIDNGESAACEPNTADSPMQGATRQTHRERNDKGPQNLRQEQQHWWHLIAGLRRHERVQAPTARPERRGASVARQCFRR